MKELQIKTWDETYAMLSQDAKKRNEPLFAIIKKISEKLGADLNYVYYTDFEFGEKVIDKGRFPDANFTVKSPNRAHNLTKDLRYSLDPLGLVISNHIEIFGENTSSGKYGENYTVYLNEIREGELFGVFGALNFIVEIDESKKRQADWHGIAGNTCLRMAFPWDKSSYTQGIDNNDIALFRNGDKVAFFKKYCPKDWKVQVAYIPKHFITVEDDNLRIKLENELHKIGWKQSSPLQDYLFENKTIIDVLYSQSMGNITHNEHFLNLLYDYILRAASGNAFVLQPVPKQHIGSVIIENFKTQNSSYFRNVKPGTNEKSKYKEPLMFHHARIGKELPWGISSLFHLPIFLNYSIKSPLKLLDDLKSINNAIDDQLKLPTIKFYSNDGNQKNEDGTKKKTPIDSHTKFKEEYINSVTGKTIIKPVWLGSREFSNLILIGKK